MNQACLSEALYQAGLEFDSSDFAALFLLSFFLAVMCAPLVLWWYQRRVEKLMRTQGSGPSRGADDPSKVAESPTAFAGEGQVLIDAAAQGARGAFEAVRHGATVFAVIAGLVMTVSAMFLDNEDLASPSAWLLSAVYALVVTVGAITPLLIMQSALKNKRVWIMVPFALLVALILEDLAFDTTMSVADRVSLSATGAIAVALLYLAIIGRRIRNVVPLLTLLMFFILGALYAVIIPIGTFTEACESGVVALVGLVLLIALPWLLTRVGFWLTGFLTDAYERNAFSDSQFQVGLWSLIIVLVIAIDTTVDDDDVMFSVWSLGIVLAWVLAAVAYGRRLRRLKPWAAPQPLLLLRVFSSRRDTHRLLDDVTYRWSFLGPIHLVGGPDLARDYLEPHELLLFLRRRLREQFILDADDLTVRLTRLEQRADPDARYRINEFFCLDDTWQLTVQRLLGLAPVILLDLRGFTRDRAGTAYELELLASSGALPRTVLIYDERTDEALVAETLEAVPGAGLSDEQIVHENDGDSVERVTAALAAAAAGAR
ncbi:MAG: hypothetical protein AAFN78_05335 [Pseudomonadota bacterium]